MEFFNDSPNLSIVLPGGCNAKCAFCFWEMNAKAAANTTPFIKGLQKTLKSLPKKFSQISITGGEPTMSPVFPVVLQIIKEAKEAPGSQWKKVVLTTNGVKLSKFIPNLHNIVDHVNISRHGIDEQSNQAVFETSSVPDASQISEMVTELCKLTIDTTLNVVVPGFELETISSLGGWVDFAKVVGAGAIAFRINHALGIEKRHALEEKMSEHGYKYKETGCPVCITRVFVYKGMTVMFKYGVNEPSATVPYELILQQTGKLTLDWAGKLPYKIQTPPKLKAKKATPQRFPLELMPNYDQAPSMGCGYSAGVCGVPSK